MVMSWWMLFINLFREFESDSFYVNVLIVIHNNEKAS